MLSFNLHWLVVSFLVVCTLDLLSCANGDAALPPVLFLPGYGASKLFGYIEAEEYIPVSCQGQNLKAKLPFPVEIGLGNVTSMDCMYELLTLNFDTTTGKYTDPVGVRISSDIFGSVNGIDKVYSPYFRALKSWGYKEGKNLFGVPYDYRLMSDRTLTANGFISALKGLVEKAYEINGQRKVLIMGHSNGGPTIYTFLQSSRLSPEWKAKFIAGMVGLSGNFLGQMNAISDFTTHNTLKEQNMTCSWEASVGSVTWGGYETVKDIPIIITYAGTASERNYTAKVEDMTALFVGVGREDWAAQFRVMYGLSPSDSQPAPENYKPENTMDRSRHPNVDVYCLYGSNISTSYAFKFAAGIQAAEPTEILYMEGDDNQDIYDNTFCNVWKNSNTAAHFKFEAKAFPGVHHMDMISDKGVLDEVHRIVQLYV